MSYCNELISLLQENGYTVYYIDKSKLNSYSDQEKVELISQMIDKTALTIAILSNRTADQRNHKRQFNISYEELRYSLKKTNESDPNGLIAVIKPGDELKFVSYDGYSKHIEVSKRDNLCLLNMNNVKEKRYVQANS